MRIHIPITDDELRRELQELADYWPLTVEELPVGRAYPLLASLSAGCTVLVSEAGSARIH